MLLLIDNYDSFAHNLARYFVQLGQEVLVRRNDEITIEEIDRLDPQAIIISPGPCGPQQAGISIDVVKQFAQRIPIFGVCLGHQVIAEAFGGMVIRSGHPVHGQTSSVIHEQESVFAGLESPFEACRYHSLTVDPDSVPVCLRITASLENGTVMGIEHRDYPVVGVQFHPESILTSCGYRILTNFLQIASIPLPAELDASLDRLSIKSAKDLQPENSQVGPGYPLPGKTQRPKSLP